MPFDFSLNSICIMTNKNKHIALVIMYILRNRYFRVFFFKLGSFMRLKSEHILLHENTLNGRLRNLFKAIASSGGPLEGARSGAPCPSRYHREILQGTS